MITVITGGTGSIKLIRGLDSVLDEKMTIITNVGDNIKLFGLYICPDIDTILYGLSKQLDLKRGWGIKNDTFNFRDSLKNSSEDIWFQIGDKDLVTHVKRTKLIEKGLNLTEITKIFAKELNIKHNIIPASDDNIETTIITDNEEMHLQEFWVKNKGKPLIKDIIDIVINFNGRIYLAKDSNLSKDQFAEIFDKEEFTKVVVKYNKIMKFRSDASQRYNLN